MMLIIASLSLDEIAILTILFMVIEILKFTFIESKEIKSRTSFNI